MTDHAPLPGPSRPPAADVLLRCLILAGCPERANRSQIAGALALALALDRARRRQEAYAAFTFEVFD